MDKTLINFQVKPYAFKEEIIKDDYPVRYFEFNRQEYYGLVAIKQEGNISKPAYKQAAQVYVDIIAGDKPNEVLEEGMPVEISVGEALLKYLLASDVSQGVIKDEVERFKSLINTSVLIDGSLT